MEPLKLLALLSLSCFVQGTSMNLYEELKNVDNYAFNLNSTCVEDITSIFSTIANQSIANKEWAITMIDASAKIPNGLLGGNLLHIGQFDECLSVIHPDGHFTGQHCMADISLSMPATAEKVKALRNGMPPHLSKRDVSTTAAVPALVLRYGICLPSTCSPEDLTQIFQTLNISSIALDDTRCWTDDPMELSAGSWAVISLIIVLLALVLCSTLYELYEIHVVGNEKPAGLSFAFSLYSNTISLFEVRSGSGDMECLHGMRTLTLAWVVLSHQSQFFASFPVVMNLLEASSVLTDANYIVILCGFFSVDTFFFLSGLLAAFVFFRNIGKAGSYDAPVNYIHRYVRLTPSLLLMVLIHMTLMGETFKGPLWGYTVSFLSQNCKNTWWSTLLYVQNYAQPEAQCLYQSWYLSLDMQMFWIAPIVLYPIYLWPKIGLGFLAFLTIGSTLLAFGLALENEFKANLLLAVSDNQYYDDYIATHTRIMPWFVGVALGVAICIIKKNKTEIRLSKLTVMLGWMFSTGVCLGILYGLTRFLRDVDPSAVESALYLSFTRLGWGVGLAWVVFACIYGYGGWVNNFLSWGIFQPLGKLSYNIYLVHMTVMLYRCATYRTNLYFDNLTLIFEYSGTIIISSLLAIVMHLLVDAPFGNLDRQLLCKIKILPYPLPKKENGKANIELGAIK